MLPKYLLYIAGLGRPTTAHVQSTAQKQRRKPRPQTSNLNLLSLSREPYAQIIMLSRQLTAAGIRVGVTRGFSVLTAAEEFPG